MRTVRIYWLPLQFPCGPDSDCCGPVGQSEDDVRALKETIERELGCKVETRNILEEQDMKDSLPIGHLIGSFGPMCLPILTVDDEIVSLGSPTPELAVSALRPKIGAKEE